MTVAAVFLGGMLGTAARLGLDLLSGLWLGATHWGTLVENVLGSFLLGLVVARLPLTAPHWLRAGLGTGLLGGFTTFSAVAVLLTTNTIVLGNWAFAAGYLVLTLVLTIAAAMLGLALGRQPVPTVSEDE